MFAQTDIDWFRRFSETRFSVALVDLLMDGVPRLYERARSFESMRKEIERKRSLSYRPTGRKEHRMDVYRMRGSETGRRPAVLFLHGGGFRIMSKDTPWMMAERCARAGYTVFVPSYRLAPEYPFPAAVEDVCSSYLWLLDHADDFNVDKRHIVFAGESAGANLALTLSLLCAGRRPEPFAREVFDSNAMPRAVVALCGLLEVSNIARYFDDCAPWVRWRMAGIERDYLRPPDSARVGGMRDLTLANPLVWLESNGTFERPLAPVHASAGTADPIEKDTKRLAHALQRRGVDVDAHYFPGEYHAFQALPGRAAADASWDRCFAFLSRVIENADRQPRTATTLYSE